MTRLLSERLGHNVVDKTGLTDKYDLVMPWPAEGETSAMPPGPAYSGQGAPPETAGPSIFTAIQEQLGLRLESRKAPIEVLVIDHVETPED